MGQRPAITAVARSAACASVLGASVADVVLVLEGATDPRHALGWCCLQIAIGISISEHLLQRWEEYLEPILCPVRKVFDDLMERLVRGRLGEGLRGTQRLNPPSIDLGPSVPMVPDEAGRGIEAAPVLHVELLEALASEGYARGAHVEVHEEADLAGEHRLVDPVHEPPDQVRLRAGVDDDGGLVPPPAHQLLLQPLHRAAGNLVASDVGHPARQGPLAPVVAQVLAGHLAVVRREVPVAPPRHVAEVAVVQELARVGLPGVAEEALVRVQLAQGVRAHDGDGLAAIEAEVPLEEVDGARAVAFWIRVPLLPRRCVRWLVRHVPDAIFPAGRECQRPGRRDSAVFEALTRVALAPRPVPVGLGICAHLVVEVQAVLHGHQRGEGPEICSGLAALLRRQRRPRRAAGEVRPRVDRLERLRYELQAVVVPITPDVRCKQAPPEDFVPEAVADALPLEAAIAAACPIGIPQAVVEAEPEDRRRRILQDAPQRPVASELAHDLVPLGDHAVDLGPHRQHVLNGPGASWLPRHVRRGRPRHRATPPRTLRQSPGRVRPAGRVVGGAPGKPAAPERPVVDGPHRRVAARSRATHPAAVVVARAAPLHVVPAPEAVCVAWVEHRAVKRLTVLLASGIEVLRSFDIAGTHLHKRTRVDVG
eukprot:CAMPEP_0171163506 /NCGR_PEP_ID=MMETSP0790-20130122/5183_1 /TAXON_ID=2925 /ORGANISM="Alexandrium catenella, Strain OF101" /LENGTH=651 /DNA_ID=CAMNT_0011628223 /DNA_START=21 /DNA_END=1976 /DNA_ORIENTATION=-